MYVSDLKTIVNEYVNEYTIKIYIPKTVSVYYAKFLSKQKLQNPVVFIAKRWKKKYIYQYIRV